MTPGEESFKLLDWLWAALVPLIGLVWKQQGDKVEALKEELNRKIASVTEETNRNRDVAAKIFEKLDTMSKESAERHMSLLTALHDGLDKKADK